METAERGPQISLWSPILRKVASSQTQLSQEELRAHGYVGTGLWKMPRKCGSRGHCQGMAPSIAPLEEAALGGLLYLWNPTLLTFPHLKIQDMRRIWDHNSPRRGLPAHSSLSVRLQGQRGLSFIVCKVGISYLLSHQVCEVKSSG